MRSRIEVWVIDLQHWWMFMTARTVRIDVLDLPFPALVQNFSGDSNPVLQQVGTCNTLAGKGIHVQQST